MSIFALNSRVTFSSRSTNSRAMRLRLCRSSAVWATVRCLLTFTPDSGYKFVEFLKDRRRAIDGSLQLREVFLLEISRLGILPKLFGFLPPEEEVLRCDRKGAAIGADRHFDSGVAGASPAGHVSLASTFKSSAPAGAVMPTLTYSSRRRMICTRCATALGISFAI